MTLKRLLILFVLLILSSPVHAQRFNQKQIHEGRYHNWEASILLQYQNSFDKDFEGGSSIDIDSSVGWGFGFAWNWTEKWHLSYRFSLNKPDYSAFIVPEELEDSPTELNHKMSKYSHQFNVTYHFLRGPLTPYLQAGIGWTKLDSNVPDQPPQTGCWWDPWWGYICSTTWSSYRTSEFTYNVGLGLRWDINALVFMRGSYNRQFINLDNGNMNLDTVTLEGGLMW